MNPGHVALKCLQLNMKTFKIPSQISFFWLNAKIWFAWTRYQPPTSICYWYLVWKNMHISLKCCFLSRHSSLNWKWKIWGKQCISNLTNSIIHSGCVLTCQIMGVEIDHHQATLQSLQREILCCICFWSFEAQLIALMVNYRDLTCQ